MNRGLLLLAAAVLCHLPPCFSEPLLPVLPAPKQYLDKGDPAPRSFTRILYEDSCAMRPYRAVCGEIEQLASPDAQDTLQIQLTRLSPDRLYEAIAAAGLTPPSSETSPHDLYFLRLEGLKARLYTVDEHGAFAALQTLKQLLRAGYPRDLLLADWSHLPLRIFMDDISRGAVPRPEQVKSRIRDLAELKYNAAMFYVENTIRSAVYPDFTPPEGCFTLDQIREFARYAESYGIELIGNFQSFGHFEKILALPAYRNLGDTESMISSRTHRARKFLRTVLSELCDCFPSEYFNVNCDETWDIGKGKSEKRVRKIGAARFYEEHLLFLHEILTQKGKKMMMWGDMLLKYPELLETLPQDITILTWNYDSRDDFSEWITPFAGRKFLVCPGVHSSNRMLPDMKAAEGNRRFITQGYRAGARGALLTSWDESTYHFHTHLCYGIAQAAETMWDTDRTTADDAFNRRYELIRFDSVTGLTALYNRMMDLDNLPMFNGMNDRIFYQRFTPQPGKPLTVDLRQLKAADTLLAKCRALRPARLPLRNAEEARAWLHILDAYDFMVGSRRAMVRISALYGQNTPQALHEAIRSCDTLTEQLQRLQQVFSELWLYENQRHSYDRGMQLYEAKIDEVNHLKDRLIQALDRIGNRQRPLSASEAGFEVKDRINGYMCFWLTTGNFTGERTGEHARQAFSHLTADPPTPGKRFPLAGTEYKWTKTDSTDGLCLDFNNFYRGTGDGTAYAYAQIIAAEECAVELQIGHVGALSCRCNDELLIDNSICNSYAPDQQKITLHLHPGVNHLLIGLKQLFPEWMFSAIVDDAPIISRKHKYTLTTNRN
ncbi:family 20 glycosylhydrolase [Alistipes sp.]|uniref:family 20 glycosylhydrolase n=1 Tax=Alistipes sp. TaxID=1872444 RepID=UPI003A8BB5C1